MKHILILAVLAIGVTPALAEAPMVGKTDKGEALVNAAGMSLYTFDKDQGGKSACDEECTEYWPPAMADEGDKPMGKFSIITRDDGTKQWAHDGHPLYGWAKDTAPGQTTGDGVKGVWHLARP